MHLNCKVNKTQKEKNREYPSEKKLQTEILRKDPFWENTNVCTYAISPNPQ